MISIINYHDVFLRGGGVAKPCASEHSLMTVLINNGCRDHGYIKKAGYSGVSKSCCPSGQLQSYDKKMACSPKGHFLKISVHFNI